MFKVFIASVLLLGFTQAVSGQESIPFYANWKKGDSFEYEISKVNQSVWKTASTSSHDSISYKAKLTVIESTPLNYKLCWIVPANLSTLPLIESTLPAAALKNIRTADLADSIQIIYTTDKHGAIAEIVNWQEIIKKTPVLYQKALALLKNTHGSAFEIERENLKDFSNMIVSESDVYELFNDQISMVHMFYGSALKPDETVDLNEAELYHLLNDEPVKGHGAFYIDSLNKQTGFARLNYHLRADEEELMLFFEEHIDQQITDPDNLLKGKYDPAKATLSNDIVTEINTRAGIVINLTFTRSMFLIYKNDSFKAEKKISFKLLQ
ncbi:hypothetical protein [Gynurincola endophyticus]|uniref:hypothetical protein n=1 Tax=Gynurincola endophyticus TaxID=2479004 RepID=UPI000F8D12D8|nr:hypothetical protein [Gynurincola endophyticus]